MQAARCLASNDYMHVVALMSKSDSRGKCLGSNDHKHVLALMSKGDSRGKCLASNDYLHVVAPASQRGTQNTPNLDFNMKGLLGAKTRHH